MNLILFTPQETGRPLPRQDPRARHILEVLRRQPGDSFDAGLIDGPRGKARLTSVSAEALGLDFAWEAEPPPLHPVRLLIGLPRPQTARKILNEATTLGVESIQFFLSARGEPSYSQSSLWSSGEWRRLVIAGAEQAFCTRLPSVGWGMELEEALDALPIVCTRLALDNYEASVPLDQAPGLSHRVALVIGPERGWAPEERDLLRAKSAQFVHLGSRVLRTETAVVASTAVVLSLLRG